MKYRKKTVVIEAIQFEGTAEGLAKIYEFLNKREPRIDYKGTPYISIDAPGGTPYISIDTLEGTMRADVGDYIIKGVKGEFYPCKPDVFEQTYEEVE